MAIVGAGTLKGKEVAEVLSDRNFPSIDVKLLDDEDSLGKLETLGDEVTFIQSVRAEQFEKVDFTFFACDQECTTPELENSAGRRAAPSSIFLTRLKTNRSADAKSPWIERQLGQASDA